MKPWLWMCCSPAATWWQRLAAWAGLMAGGRGGPRVESPRVASRNCFRSPCNDENDPQINRQPNDASRFYPARFGWEFPKLLISLSVFAWQQLPVSADSQSFRCAKDSGLAYTVIFSEVASDKDEKNS